MKLCWNIFQTGIIVLISIGGYQLHDILSNETQTTLTTPNLGTQCNISQKLLGYDTSGNPLCAIDLIGNGTTSINNLDQRLVTSNYTYELLTNKTFYYLG